MVHGVMYIKLLDERTGATARIASQRDQSDSKNTTLLQPRKCFPCRIRSLAVSSGYLMVIIASVIIYISMFKTENGLLQR